MLPRVRVTILGATGSIGTNTLAVMETQRDAFDIFALSGYGQIDLLVRQCIRYRPQWVCVPLERVDTFRDQLVQQDAALAKTIQIAVGEQGLIDLATHPHSDVVVAGIVGAAGLRSTYHAALAGKKILLANKESLVMAGEIFMQAVREHGAQVLPIDSEHNAIFQCLPFELQQQLVRAQTSVSLNSIKRIILTASGGPLRQLPTSALVNITPEIACRHPNWQMGRKISIDSATLMNKGLELIEACVYFHLPASQIDIVVHPQSIIHSMVQFVDGSLLAQLGSPDMQIPIAYTLSWPQRMVIPSVELDLCAVAQLTFEPPDEAKFPCIRLAKEVANGLPYAAIVLNAANEIAVEAFLAGQIQFINIPQVLEQTLQQISASAVATIDDILALDFSARRCALTYIEHINKLI